MADRQMRVRWVGSGAAARPLVENLTGTEARSLARAALLEARRLDELRAATAMLIVALVHRDAQRGVLGPDGEPVLPMTLTVPAGSAKAAAATPRTLRWAQRPDGSIEIIVDAEPST